MNADKRNRLTQILFILSLCCLAGCGVVSPEEKDEVLEKDPSFKQVLEKKRSIDSEINALKNELKDKKNIINSKIDILKKEFRQEKEKIGAKITELKSQLDSERSLIEDEKKLLSRDIKEKEIALNDADKTIRDLENLISKEGRLDISNQEVTRWQQRIKALEEEKSSIRKDLRKLRDELDILDTKIKLLR